jgi:hypothetical protein
MVSFGDFQGNNHNQKVLDCVFGPHDAVHFVSGQITHSPLIVHFKVFTFNVLFFN